MFRQRWLNHLFNSVQLLNAITDQLILSSIDVSLNLLLISVRLLNAIIDQLI